MAAIKIEFPKISYTTSTWVPDEHWTHLSPQQKTALIFRFIKNHHAAALHAAQGQSHPKTSPNYRWSEI